jgi:hypothetical protein
MVLGNGQNLCVKNIFCMMRITKIFNGTKIRLIFSFKKVKEGGCGREYY